MAIARGRRWRELAVPVDMVDRAPRAEVDVALVLAVDSSGSISEQRLTMQIQGYIDALRHPSFIEAIGGGRRGRIGLTYVTWTDARRQDQVVPWRVIEDQPSANAFAQAIHDALRPLPGWTSISGAIDFCTGLLLSSGYIATRRVIDISGDGANNDGRPVTEARDAAVAAGVTINGLPIIEVEPESRTVLPGQCHWRTRCVRCGGKRNRQPSVRRSCASCWSRSPAFRRPTRAEARGLTPQAQPAL